MASPRRHFDHAALPEDVGEGAQQPQQQQDAQPEQQRERIVLLGQKGRLVPHPQQALLHGEPELVRQVELDAPVELGACTVKVKRGEIVNMGGVWLERPRPLGGI